MGEEFPNSPRGNHVLVLINTTEDYEHLEDAVSELAAEVQKINVIKINDTTYKIEYFLGGDWKFLAICQELKQQMHATHVYGANAQSWIGMT